MSVINRVPWGLQDILGSTSQGKNPSELLDQVRPSFDMFPLWAMERLETRRVFTTLVSVGTNLDIEIPDGEMWIPFHMQAGITGVNDIGTIIGFELLILNMIGAGTSSRYWGSDVITAVAVGEIINLSFDFPYPVLWESGTVFRMSPSVYVRPVANDSGEANIFFWKLAK